MLRVGDVDVILAQAQELRVLHKFLSRALHIGRESGGEHYRMQVAAGQIALDLAHVLIEAHREHTVSLVKDEHFQIV